MNIATGEGETGFFAILEDAIPATSPADLQDLVVEKLGQAHRIEGVATLGHVGFRKWPLTVGGKVARHELRPAIETYLASAPVES